MIAALLLEQPPRFRVRCEKGGETIFSQAAGAGRIERPCSHTRALSLRLGLHHFQPVRVGRAGPARRRSRRRCMLERTTVEAHHDAPLPRPHRLNRTKGNGPPPREQAASANDDLVGMVGVPLVANVVEPAEVRAVTCHHSVPLGGGEQATELRLPPQAMLTTLIPDPLAHSTEA
jgi:hypothetical protein